MGGEVQSCEGAGPGFPLSHAGSFSQSPSPQAVQVILRLSNLLLPLGVVPSIAAYLRWCRYLRLSLTPDPLPLIPAQLLLGARVLFLEGMPRAAQALLDPAAVAAIAEPPEPGLWPLLQPPTREYGAYGLPFTIAAAKPPTLKYLSLSFPPVLGDWGQPVLPSLVATPTLLRLFAAVVCALGAAHPLLLTGPCATGKTAVLREVAALAQKSVFVLQCNEGHTAQDLYGGVSE